MATKQYIGARYVPKFFDENNGEWLPNTQYEPLTIVQYSGNSYTSKKEIPANIGNPSSNPEYWASTGNYNAQVEEYRQDVEEYKEDVEEYKDHTENYVTPEDFDAVGDGVTDDTNAIKSALNSGKNVLLTKKYLVTSAIMENINNVNVIGVNGASIILSGKLTLNQLWNIEFKDITFELTDDTSDYLIEIKKSYHIKAISCLFYNSDEHTNVGGVLLNGHDYCYYNQFVMCRFLYWDKGIVFQESANACTIENSEFYKCYDNIYINSSNNVVVNNNSLQSFKRNGIVFDYDSSLTNGTLTKSNVIQNNFIEYDSESDITSIYNFSNKEYCTLNYLLFNSITYPNSASKYYVNLHTNAKNYIMENNGAVPQNDNQIPFSIKTDGIVLGSDNTIAEKGKVVFSDYAKTLQVYDDSDSQWHLMQRISAYASNARPTNVGYGTMIFDTTLNKPIWYVISGWVDATGTSV